MVNLRQTKLVLGVLAVILAVVAQRVWSQETAVRSLNASDSSEDSSLAPVVAADNLREGFGQVPSDASRADLFGSRPIVQLAQAVQPAVQPTLLPPATTSTATPSTPSTDIGLGSVGSSFLLDLQSVLQPSPGSPLIPTNKNDATTLLENVPGITLERRVQSVHDGILRGRRLGQVLAKGSDWFPARQDLDTPLSKIDSRIRRAFYGD